MKGFQRADDFSQRRAHLQNLDDTQLKELFWSKVGQIVQPLLELAKENTSPAIERSVLLRMGFSSIEADALVDLAIDKALIGHGVGHVVYAVGKKLGQNYRQTGLELIEGKHWDVAEQLMKGASHE